MVTLLVKDELEEEQQQEEVKKGEVEDEEEEGKEGVEPEGWQGGKVGGR